MVYEGYLKGILLSAILGTSEVDIRVGRCPRRALNTSRTCQAGAESFGSPAVRRSWGRKSLDGRLRRQSLSQDGDDDGIPLREPPHVRRPAVSGMAQVKLGSKTLLHAGGEKEISAFLSCSYANVYVVLIAEEKQWVHQIEEVIKRKFHSRRPRSS